MSVHRVSQETYKGQGARQRLEQIFCLVKGSKYVLLCVRNEINACKQVIRRFHSPRIAWSKTCLEMIWSLFPSFHLIWLETAGRSESLHNLSSDAEGKNVQVTEPQVTSLTWLTQGKIALIELRTPTLSSTISFHVQLCSTLCDPGNWSPPGLSVHGILQARILEWTVISSSRGSSPPRDWTHVSWVSCTGRRILYHYATGKHFSALRLFKLILLHVANSYNGANCYITNILFVFTKGFLKYSYQCDVSNSQKQGLSLFSHEQRGGSFLHTREGLVSWPSSEKQACGDGEGRG